MNRNSKALIAELKEMKITLNFEDFKGAFGEVDNVSAYFNDNGFGQFRELDHINLSGLDILRVSLLTMLGEAQVLHLEAEASDDRNPQHEAFEAPFIMDRL
jgi:hypothetical protein